MSVGEIRSELYRQAVKALDLVVQDYLYAPVVKKYVNDLKKELKKMLDKKAPPNVMADHIYEAIVGQLGIVCDEYCDGRTVFGAELKPLTVRELNILMSLISVAKRAGAGIMKLAERKPRL